MTVFIAYFSLNTLGRYIDIFLFSLYHRFCHNNGYLLYRVQNRLYSNGRYADDENEYCRIIGGIYVCLEPGQVKASYILLLLLLCQK